MIIFSDIANQYPPYLQAFKRNILREYLQYKILAAIFASKYSAKLSFIGGTALRIVHNNTRFSEDLDFDNFGLTEADFEDVSLVIKLNLEREGYEVEVRNVYKGAFRCYCKIPKILYQQKLSPIEEEKILIQIDTAPHHFLYKPDIKILNKFEVFAPINVTPLDILLAQKIYAALTRKTPKGRDFFDIVFLTAKTKANADYLYDKLKVKSDEEVKKLIEENTKSFDFNKLAQDVSPFLFNSLDVQKVVLFSQYIKTVFLV